MARGLSTCIKRLLLFHRSVDKLAVFKTVFFIYIRNPCNRNLLSLFRIIIRINMFSGKHEFQPLGTASQRILNDAGIMAYTSYYKLLNTPWYCSALSDQAAGLLMPYFLKRKLLTVGQPFPLSDTLIRTKSLPISILKSSFFSYLSSFPNRSDPVKKKKYNDLDRYDRGSDRCSGQNRSQDAGNRTDYRHY